jgi:hypothetical protein
MTESRNYGTFPWIPLPDPRRLRSYLNRLPLATRGFLAVLTILYVVSVIVPGIRQWGALIPMEIGLHTCTLHFVSTTEAEKGRRTNEKTWNREQ